MNKVYIVTGIFNTESDHDTIVEAFKNPDKAKEFLDRCISDERESDWFKELPYPTIISNEDGTFWRAHQKNNPDNFSEYSIEERILK